MRTEEFFSGEWQSIVPRLRAMLARAGVPASDRDDLVQETALRIMGMWDRVDKDSTVEPLARRIAINVWRDRWRTQGRREVVGVVPELSASADTEREALARVEVREVAHALEQLGPAAATVLRIAAGESEGVEPAIAGALPAAVRMARSRARRALAAAVKVASVAAAVCAAGLRWGTRPARNSSVTVGALAALTIALALGHVAIGQNRLTTPTRPVVAHPPAAGAVHLVRPHLTALAHSSGHVPVTVAAAAPNHKASKPRHAPFTVPVGPTHVGVLVHVKVQGYGVAVQQPESGSKLPLCVYGKSPTNPVVPRCS